MNRVKVWNVLVITMVLALAPIVQSQTRSNRASHREAAEAEYLITKLYPGAQYRWNPDLEFQDSEGVWHEFAIDDSYKTKSDKTIWGVINYSTDATQMSKYLEKLEGGIVPIAIKFPVHMVAFRGIQSGNVVTFAEMKKFDVDAGNSVLFSIQYMDTLGGAQFENLSWPVFTMTYRQCFLEHDGVPLCLILKANYDTNSERFLTRIPTGVMMRYPQGHAKETLGIGYTRSNANELAIEVVGDQIENAKVPVRRFSYSCGDPCVWEPENFVDKWEKAATIWVPFDLGPDSN